MPKTTRDRCITPSFSPSTYHRGKLMDGEPWPHVRRSILATRNQWRGVDSQWHLNSWLSKCVFRVKSERISLTTSPGTRKSNAEEPRLLANKLFLGTAGVIS